MHISLPTSVRGWVLLVIGVVYLGAFALPAFDNSAAPFHHMSMRPRGLVLGWEAFILSFVLFPHPGWLANPLFWGAARSFQLRRFRRAAILSCLASGLGASYLVLLSDRSIIYEQRFSTGYYVWLVSLGLLVMAAFVGMSVLRRTEVEVT
jgi:hypothetical protein